MTEMHKKRSNVNLSDYDYQRDLHHRLHLSELTVFEVEVLREILDNSLKFPISQLQDTFNLSATALSPILKKLSKSNLIQCKDQWIYVDKELRKFYELHIRKFEKDFTPDLEFLLGMLSKIPIHVLPNWYSLPGMTDNIFTSLVENYFLTPKIYERHLNEIQFPEPLMHEILKEVFQEPSLRVPVRTLMDKYAISRKDFELYMLHLEYYFVCCLSYEQNDEGWEEVVTPFYEWRTYLSHTKKLLPLHITNHTNIQRLHPHDFGFLEDIARLLQEAQLQVIRLSKKGKQFILADTDAKALFPHLDNAEEREAYGENIIIRLTGLNLAHITAQGVLEPFPNSHEWLALPFQEKALSIYRNAIFMLRNSLEASTVFSERDIRETERSLRQITSSGWIYLDDFMKGLTAPIGSAEAVYLQNKGKKWSYVLPVYTEADHAFVRHVLWGPIFEAGIIAIGNLNGRECLRVTPFGKTF